MREFEVILFDLDNTLVDFTGNACISLKRAIGSRLEGVKFDDFWEKYVREAIRAWEEYSRGEIGRDEMRKRRLQRALALFDIKFADLNSINSQYVKNLIDLTDTPIAGVSDSLSALSGEGFRLGVLTNGFSDIAMQRMQNSGIAHMFEHVVISEELGIHKPHPGIFEHALRLFDVDNREAVYVGDSVEFDIMGAAAADIRGVLYAPGGVPAEAKVRRIPTFTHYDQLQSVITSL